MHCDFYTLNKCALGFQMSPKLFTAGYLSYRRRKVLHRHALTSTIQLQFNNSVTTHSLVRHSIHP